MVPGSWTQPHADIRVRRSGIDSSRAGHLSRTVDRLIRTPLLRFLSLQRLPTRAALSEAAGLRTCPLRRWVAPMRVFARSSPIARFSPAIGNVDRPLVVIRRRPLSRRRSATTAEAGAWLGLDGHHLVNRDREPTPLLGFFRPTQPLSCNTRGEPVFFYFDRFNPTCRWKLDHLDAFYSRDRTPLKSDWPAHRPTDHDRASRLLGFNLAASRSGLILA